MIWAALSNVSTIILRTNFLTTIISLIVLGADGHNVVKETGKSGKEINAS